MSKRQWDLADAAITAGSRIQMQQAKMEVNAIRRRILDVYHISTLAPVVGTPNRPCAPAINDGDVGR